MDVDNSLLWQSAMAEIQLTVSSNTYNGFFKNTRLVKIENNIAEIAAPTPVIISYLESRYYMFIKNMLEKRTKTTLSLIFSSESKEKDTTPQKKKEADLFSSLPAPSVSSAPTSENIYARRAGLREDFTFDNFAVSTTNEMAYAAAEAVAREPGKAYNPFFIYGGVGVGKTHLMQAVGRKILEENREKRVKYLTGEEFTNEIVDAIRAKSTNDFKKKYRQLDCLLLDDVQFIAGKEQIQEEFFHTFNAVLSSGGQVILTSDRPPEEIQKLEDRMKSRFQAGLIVDISTPNFELRCAILKIKAERRGISFPQETILALGEEIKSAREIEGALLTIKTYLLKNPESDLSVSSVKNILRIKTDPDLMKKAVDQATITGAVCDYYQIKPTALKGERRIKNIVVPRQILMYLLKTEAGMTFSEIGNLLGGRDHTTIMHGVEKMERLVEKDNGLQKQIFDIKAKFTT